MRAYKVRRCFHLLDGNVFGHGEQALEHAPCEINHRFAIMSISCYVQGLLNSSRKKQLDRSG